MIKLNSLTFFSCMIKLATHLQLAGVLQNVGVHGGQRAAEPQ
eukprot:COSAG05_NODE_13316_length_434_cov_1.080597_1_plen_41_part_01